MSEKIMVNIRGVGEAKVLRGTSLFELSEKYAASFARPALVAKVNNELQDLSRPVLYDSAVEFLDITNSQGFRAYQRGLSFLMVYAAKTVLGKKARVVINHSINKNFCCELPEFDEISKETLAEIEAVMRAAVAKDLPIERHTMPKELALSTCEELGLYDKISLLKYRTNMSFSFYKLDWMYNYFYGEMPPRLGRLDKFKLVKRTRGFMLQFPAKTEQYELSELAPENRISEVFSESKRWMRIMKADTVGALNDKLCQDGNGEIIRVAEALHEKKIAALADQIMQEHRPIVLIAGPSSSGKTTFASRLGVQLRVNGAVPHIISLDNYYLNREDCPLDEFGNYDFETIDAIDTEQIVDDLNALLAGESVEIPSFNFYTGRREYKGNVLKLSPADVLIMEGIHGLNERVGGGVPSSDKFKIFISALTQINIDDHNRIATTDARLMRRMVRDFLFRGTVAAKTLDMWPSVLRGEIKYIYPNQERADAFFNSALVYEMCVLKQYAEPLLFGITPNDPHYSEARRLIKLLSSFLGVPSETIPSNSILREFVGGSCFHH
ncbi:MAG: nucleoside kinase [Defluviitaleaceae bacterium]|nr:nucleoside kinase [Defluviitaleaceae bacterium]MCL2263539.1 nucleoside kinase [Defluviitaleaceae bacterium]